MGAVLVQVSWRAPKKGRCLACDWSYRIVRVCYIAIRRLERQRAGGGAAGVSAF